MATISPFRPYRYSASAGKLDDLVTQPHDKISPDMRARYLSLSPHNLVRIILDESSPSDSAGDNVYTRAAAYFEQWIRDGILLQDDKPAFYVYSQEFEVPDTGETLVRKGFIGLCSVGDYEAGVVHRHEQTLSGPKKDRHQVLEHTRAHFGHIFMLYPDAQCQTDALLDAATAHAPTASVVDEYGTKHRLYAVADTDTVNRFQQLLADKKLLIADGHHRYETALAFRKDHPAMADARWVMATFVNMHSSGLRILATHRVIGNLQDFDAGMFLREAGTRFRIMKFDTLGAMMQVWDEPALDRIRIGVVHAGSDAVYLLERDREPGALDVDVLHRELVEGALGIDEQAVREQKFLTYVRGLENAVHAVANGEAQVALLLQPTSVQQVADTAFGGKTMPQKSTDFFPKLLSGLTIYRLEK